METAEIRSFDATRLRVLRWSPEGEAKGLVVIVHGSGEHAGRYEHVAKAFAKQGWAVHAGDLRGLGASGGLKGHVDGFEQYVGDVEAVLDAAEVPGPRFLYGHSMGALVTLAFLRMRPKTQLAGAILSGPPLKLAFDPPKWKTIMGTLLSRVLPGLRLDAGLDASTLSHDEEVVRGYETDPLVFRAISTRWYTSMVEAANEANAHPEVVRIPTLWMVGTDDAICHPDGSRALVNRLEGDHTLMEWPGLFHEIHNEPSWEKVTDAMLDWLDQHKS